jgi:phosphatidylinositol dimannoside acyltransferase
VDLITPAYRSAAALARALPGPAVDLVAPQICAVAALRPGDRRAMVERHQRRVTPGLTGGALRRRVRGVYRSYARYYAESFRLPSVSAEELDDRFTFEGMDHLDRAVRSGTGPLMAMPHLGSWEWCAFWLTRVHKVPVTAVVERIEPPALFDWFVDLRQSMGLDVVPLGPDAGRAIVGAVKAGHVVPLLCDRDIGHSGVEVTFFGEKTTLPSGPAVLALRTGAPILPAAQYDRGRGHHGLILPPVPADRRGTFRADVARITQEVAFRLEGLIARAPEQWHLMQPNWPSDYAEAPVRL